MEPGIYYKNRLDELKADQKRLRQKKSVFGLLRFGTIAAIIAVFYFLGSVGLVYAVIAGVLLAAIFVQLIYRDLANRAAIKHLDHLVAINEDELRSLNGAYFQFGDGAAYLPKEHNYAADIDIFGHASLYQFLNRTVSDMGAARLASWLSGPATIPVIRHRQSAAKELARKILWGQELQAYGRESGIRESTFARLQQWLHEPALFSGFVHWKWLRYVLPAIILTIVTAALASWIPMGVMYGSLLVFAVIAYQVNRVIAPVHERLSKMVNELETLSRSVALVEKEPFTSEMLLELKSEFKQGNITASSRIRQLKKILDRLDIRYNIVLSAPLNLLLLWNLQQVLGLEQWKSGNASNVESWFVALGKLEALNSFAVLHFNNPDWCFPVLVEEHFVMEGESLGHPLINQDKRVNNYIHINEAGELMLVTGSNMAGKSTYLRSVGVNVVLAMAGAPVCASSFRLSPVQLLSSMRIADNLEESTSTFYAELKKLKTVIEKVNGGEKVFILLDEILRGTNSFDRHTGSVALIRQLIRHQAVGIIATHDLALAELQKEFPRNILNYHFDVQVTNDELHFDYKLKTGVCTSLNASILMKKIGIEL